MNLNDNKDTSLLLDIFLEKIDDFPFNINYEDSTIKSIIKKFYNELHNIETNNKKLNYTQKYINKSNHPKIEDLLKSNFTPKKIKTEMNKINEIIEFNVIIHSIPIKVIFLLIPNKNPNIYLFNFQKICSWLQFIIPYSNSKMKSFKMVLYLSDFKKKLPNNQTDILDNIHCNTAVTYACAINGSCLIYREEEWFKVMIHETMHAFCLDFSGLDYKSLRRNMKKIFPLKIDFEISESYSEFWATILNSLFKSYYLIQDDKINDFEIYYYNFSSFVYLEIAYSLFQTVKLMKFMNIEYEDLYKNKVIYKQKTNVFEYYIIKMIYLFNYIEFLKLCKINNTNYINFYKSNTMLNKIFEFTKDYYDDNHLLESINYMESFYNNNNNKFLKTTLRMSMF